jgi:hypothetical protein
VKGYSDTRSLGLSKFDKALAATIKTFVMLTGPAQERIAVRTKGRQDQAT